MIIITQLPFIVTLGISFMNWNAYYPDEIGFNGLDNCPGPHRREHPVRDRRHRHPHGVVVLISLVLGLLIALLLDRQFRAAASSAR